MAVYNFNAGPSALPASVLEEAKKSLFQYKDSQMSVMEMSHRGKHYEEIHYEAIERIRHVLNVPNDYHILLLQGGASLQFAMIPLNFLRKDEKGAYILSGSWSEKAWNEATIVGNTYILASSKENNYRAIPEVNLENIAENTSYLHLTSNNTIYGTQWKDFPKEAPVPLFVDASSDIFSRQVDWNHVQLMYAGAQKNAGPAGVTVVILKKDLLNRAASSIPKILQYKTHAEKDSLYHTPPTASIFMLGLVMKWIEAEGGVKKMEELATKKAEILYNVIDESEGFYKGHAAKESRSKMNVTFTIADKELEKKFIAESEQKGFVGIKGHRSVGGCRASIYNAVPIEHVEKLAQFMIDFQKKYR